MHAIDIFYYSVAIGFIVLVAFVSFAAFRLAKALHSVKMLIDDVWSLTHSVEKARGIVWSGTLGILISILRTLFRKRGDNHGRN